LARDRALTRLPGDWLKNGLAQNPAARLAVKAHPAKGGPGVGVFLLNHKTQEPHRRRAVAGPVFRLPRLAATASKASARRPLAATVAIRRFRGPPASGRQPPREGSPAAPSALPPDIAGVSALRRFLADRFVRIGKGSRNTHWFELQTAAV
jgi:hypothetical protein